MKFKGQISRCRKMSAVAILALVISTHSAFSQPALPPDPMLDIYSFQNTNWLGEHGYAPLRYTNLVSVPEWRGNGLLLDTTNALPAYLAYNIVETNGHTNLAFPAGAIMCVFTCNWASADTNQSGAGLGDTGYLLGAGDFSSGSPDGLWAIYIDAAGTNLSFGGVSNSASSVFVSAPISWPSNSIHLIGISYCTNTLLYIDGQLAATGGPVTIVPETNVWTNGFNVGSDASGYHQAQGAFAYLELNDSNWFRFNGASYFTNRWPYISNAFATWLGIGGSSFSYGRSSGSLLSGGGSGACSNGTDPYMTNMSYSAGSGPATFTFTITGGIPDFGYDVFRTTNLAWPLNTTVWTWLGQGTNCGIYTDTNAPTAQSYYLLGNALASDGSGLSQAYENLISTNFYGDTYGTPTAWYLGQGLNPQIAGIANDDPDGDGLLNYQEYLYGTNPQVSEGFNVWVSEPELTSGIP